MGLIENLIPVFDIINEILIWTQTDISYDLAVMCFVLCATVSYENCERTLIRSSKSDLNNWTPCQTNRNFIPVFTTVHYILWWNLRSIENECSICDFAIRTFICNRIEILVNKKFWYFILGRSTNDASDTTLCHTLFCTIVRYCSINNLDMQFIPFCNLCQRKSTSVLQIEQIHRTFS